jgi:hypothetical protein
MDKNMDKISGHVKFIIPRTEVILSANLTYITILYLSRSVKLEDCRSTSGSQNLRVLGAKFQYSNLKTINLGLNNLKFGQEFTF